jgi:hypothetical protein
MRAWQIAAFLGSIIGCGRPGIEAPASLIDPLDQISYLAFADLHRDSSAQCFVISSRGVAREPSGAVSALLVKPGMRVVPLAECSRIFGDGDLHDVLNISIALPVLGVPAQKKLDIPYSRLCGSLCGDSGTCRFVRRGQRWFLQDCSLERIS